MSRKLHSQYTTCYFLLASDVIIRCREHWEKKHHSASDLVESVKSVEKDHKSPVNWILEDVTLPPTIATPQQRVVLAGAWNDLG